MPSRNLWRLVGALVGAFVGATAAGLLDSVFQVMPLLDALRYAPDTVCSDGPVTLSCLLSNGGAVGAGAAAGAAASDGWQPGMAPPRAPETPAEYSPPPDQTGYDAINDPAFQAQRDQYARDHSDRTPPPPPPGVVERVMGNFGASVREYYGRQ